MLQEGVDREVDEPLGALGHRHKTVLERIELLMEVPKPRRAVGGTHPNLPVM
jgi:hypothetical protein